MGRRKTGKIINCFYCGKEIYVFGKKLKNQNRFYCSNQCRANDNPPWNKGLTKKDDVRLKSISEKAQKQMFREYNNGVRDRYKITEKARKVSHKKLKQNNWLVSKKVRDKLRKVQRTKEYREKASNSKKGSRNPMFGKKPWNKLSPTKKWWEEKEFIRLRKICLKRDNFQCVKCGEKKKNLYCDHIIPYRVCKEHKIENLQMLCGKCHSKKTARDIKKYPELRK